MLKPAPASTVAAAPAGAWSTVVPLQPRGTLPPVFCVAGLGGNPMNHRFELRDAHHWMEKQVYLAAGTLLLGAAALQIDACPIEGFDQKVLDEELGLRAMGYTSAVIVALGYRSDSDFNAQLPKSRLPAERVISRI